MEERTDTEQIIDEIAELKLIIESVEAGVEFIMKNIKGEDGLDTDTK